jgi:2-octaprenylphenol hydroxylase
MQKFDVLIVGGGMVGLTFALALRKQTDLSIAIADTSPMVELTQQPEVRVSAINIASQQIFENLGVWQTINLQRSQAYQHMHIWDKAGYGQLDFDLSDLADASDVFESEQLGWIVENKVIRNALWQAAQADEKITFFTEEAISNIGVGESEVFASFTRQMPITAKLVVGADGANSWVRKQMNMPIAFRDYDHHAIVATVQCHQGHQNTAWQVFLPTGPLAFLPLSSKDKEASLPINDNASNAGNLCSIVWSTSPQEAVRLTQLTPEDFSKELSAASDGKLGVITLESERFTHPLTMRLAHDFVKERIVLVGDAAHTIHPLAGQGVNLGLLDAAALAQTLAEQCQLKPESWLNNKSLKAFARWRKTEASEMVAAMEAIKQIFTPQQGLAKFVRGAGLSLLNQIKPAKSAMIKQALGLKTGLPSLARKKYQD